MPDFQYKARNADGKLVSGILPASSPVNALSVLRARGLSPIHMEMAAGSLEMPGPARAAAASGHGGGVMPWRPGRVSGREVMLTLKQLAGLLTAGVAVDRALRLLAAAKKGAALSRRLNAVQRDVESGKSLSGSLAAAGLRLPPYALSLIGAGELSGDLEGALLTVAGVMERNASIRAMVRNSLTYPAFMIVASLGALVLLFTFMLPRFTFVDSLSGSSSQYLQFLMGVSAGLRRLAWPFLICVIVALLTWRLWRQAAWETVQKVALRAPLIGRSMKVSATSRLLRCLGSLLKGGVTLPEALAAVVDVAGYKEYARIVQITADKVAMGVPLSAVWQQHHIMPSVAVELVRVGEETGDLAVAFGQGADLLEEDLRQWVAKFTAVFEPVLILAIAGVVGFVVVSILLPVIDLSDIPI